MSREKAPIRNPESSGNTSHELGKRSHELEKNRHENAAEALKGKHENAAEASRKQIEKEAISGKEYAPQQSEKKSQAQPITRQQEKNISFQTTMNHVRKDLSRQERVFSKIIHQPLVEKASDMASKTIARPSGIIGGTIAAFIGLLSVYGIARFAGFSLSGSEFPVLIIMGFAAGLFFEWLVKSIRSILVKTTK